MPTIDPIRLPWGLQPPAGAVAAWGARAIYRRNDQAYKANLTAKGAMRKRGRVPWFFVELLSDRQSFGGAEATVVELQTWINKVALPRLRKEIELDPRDDASYEWTDGRFTIRANPRASCGYLYIGAWSR